MLLYIIYKIYEVCTYLVASLVSDSMDCSPPGSSVHGDLPDPAIEPTSLIPW